MAVFHEDRFSGQKIYVSTVGRVHRDASVFMLQGKDADHPALFVIARHDGDLILIVGAFCAARRPQMR